MRTPLARCVIRQSLQQIHPTKFFQAMRFVLSQVRIALQAAYFGGYHNTPRYRAIIYLTEQRFRERLAMFKGHSHV